MARTSAFRPEVRRVLPALLGLRFVSNTGGRMVFSFLPAITRGTGLSVEEMGQILFLRDLTGLAAGRIGRVIDRWGQRKAMVGGGLLLGIGLLLAMLGPVGVLVGFVLVGFGRLSLGISMTAWIGDEVAYAQRGRATGLVELTWAGAALIGVPICGVLIDVFNWWTPFLVLGVATIGFSLAQGEIADHRASSTIDGRPNRLHLSRSTIAALSAPALLLSGATMLFFGHGTWLEEVYDFNATRIGFAVITVGLAEFGGSYGSSWLTDRLGKRQSILGGSALMLVAVIGLAIAPEAHIVVGLGLLLTAFLGFEFAIVSSIPLMSELDTDARARMVGLSIGVKSVARATAALLAGWVDQNYGFEVLAAISAVLVATSMVVMLAVSAEY
ncbi:MAG: MFS transporter [Acidimicrobiales bacterium]|nr:MFS transporter [Acidimicrobiales bacterium]